MRGRTRFALATLVSFAVAAPILAAISVHRAVPEAHAMRSPFSALAADSAAGDAAAMAALPTRLRALFAVHDVIGIMEPESLPLYECIQLDGGDTTEVRRRLQVRFPDSSAAVLFVVAQDSTASLRRVEFLRRTPREGQRGFIWDHVRDRTSSVWWFETPRGLSRREERGEVPRGGPVPRAVRALGRRLLVAPCRYTSVNSPMNPISGSRD